MAITVADYIEAVSYRENDARAKAAAAPTSVDAMCECHHPMRDHLQERSGIKSCLMAGCYCTGFVKRPEGEAITT